MIRTLAVKLSVPVKHNGSSRHVHPHSEGLGGNKDLERLYVIVVVKIRERHGDQEMGGVVERRIYCEGKSEERVRDEKEGGEDIM